MIDLVDLDNIDQLKLSLNDMHTHTHTSLTVPSVIIPSWVGFQKKLSISNTAIHNKNFKS